MQGELLLKLSIGGLEMRNKIVVFGLFYLLAAAPLVAQSTLNVTVEWDASSGGLGALRYQVEISQDQQNWQAAGGLVSALDQMFDLASNSGNLFVRVRARDDFQFSSPRYPYRPLRFF